MIENRKSSVLFIVLSLFFSKRKEQGHVLFFGA